MAGEVDGAHNLARAAEVCERLCRAFKRVYAPAIRKIGRCYIMDLYEIILTYCMEQEPS